MADPNAIAQYIWRRSQELGLDPRMTLGIARYEGLNPQTLGAPTFGNPDAKGYSFGPFQLYSASPDPNRIAPGGLAYEFQQRYGAAPSAQNWQQQVDFSLETMKRRGTSPWYAVRDQGGVDAIAQKGARYAAELGLVPGQTPAAATPAPAQPAAPVYANDWSTAARRVGNAIAPDMVAAPTPLTTEQAQAQRQQATDANALMSASKSFLQLASLAAPKQQEEAMLPPIRPMQARPVQLRRMRGLL